MMMKHVPLTRVALAATLVFAMAGTGVAQCSPAQWSLSTGFAGGNGCSGNFFDVTTTTNVTVCSFDVHLGINTAQTMEVWAVIGGGPYSPVAATPSAWTLLASVTVTGAGAGVPTPLNLNLAYLIPSGTTQGFLVRNVTSTNIDYTNGTTLGAVAASNADMTILQGQYTCTIGATFPALTAAVRVFNGTIHYSTSNQLAVTQSALGAGDLTISLSEIAAGATEGWTLLSLDTSLPVGAGPLVGIVPDATTFELLFSSPLFDGNPLHFPVPSQFGLFPNNPFYLPPGSVPFMSGTTIDFVALLIGPGFTYIGSSGVVRYTF